MKVKMLRDGGGYPKGAVVDPREGIARTLIAIGAAEHVEQRKVDSSEDEQPKRTPRKRKRSKATPKDG